MDLTPIITRLRALETELARKGFARPEVDLTIPAHNKFRVWVWAEGVDPTKPADDKSYRGFYSESVEAAFEAAETWLAEQPEPEVRDLQVFQKMLADTIDFANEKQIDVQFVTPVVETARALASNLLTYQRA